MRYKVIALSVGGLGNKVYRFGDEVTEGNFPKDRFAEILKGGFLEPIGGVKASEKVTETKTNEFKLDNVFTKTEKKASEDITASEIKTYLDEKGVEYNKRASKGDLYSLYLVN